MHDRPLFGRRTVNSLRFTPPHPRAMPLRPVPVGIGIYSRPEAAHLLHVTASRLRRWVSGYTYQIRDSERAAPRRGTVRPVIRSDLPTLRGVVALSFVELMELRVVKALVDRGLSLQHVRRAAAVAAETFHTAHPFASRRVYTDGARVFATLAAGPTTPDLIALTRRDVLQVIAGGIFEPFLDEIDFDETTAYASRWWPLGRQVPIVLDPRVAFGAPVIAGTRLRTTLIAGLAHETTEPAVADTYIVGVAAVRAAVRFESMLAAA